MIYASESLRTDGRTSHSEVINTAAACKCSNATFREGTKQFRRIRHVFGRIKRELKYI